LYAIGCIIIIFEDNMNLREHLATNGKMDARNRRPLSDEIRDAILTDYIEGAEIQPHFKFPTEAELCDRYAVSRITVRSALRGLQAAGLLTVRHGQGWALVARSEIITSGLDRLCSFERYAADSGYSVETSELNYSLLKANDFQAKWLNIARGDEFLRVERIKLFNGVKVAWMVDYVPAHIYPPEDFKRDFAGSALDLFANHPRTGLSYSEADMSPVGLDAKLANKLGVAKGAPALFIDELLFNANGGIIEGGHAWLLPEHFRFRLRRRMSI